MSDYEDRPTFPYPWCNITELEDILKFVGVTVVIAIAVYLWW